jgi:hypothetical protein
MVDLPRNPITVMENITNPRFEMIREPVRLTCPVCGEVWARSLASHAEYMSEDPKDGPEHLVLLVMES